jgi:hypothetical protein
VSTAWFSGLAAASATVDCDGEAHTVQWRDGVFHIPAHGDAPDLEAERALAALGGGTCRCVELFLAWHRYAGDPQALMLGPRGHEAVGEARIRNDPAQQLHRARLRQRGMLREPEPSPLVALISLDGSIPRRLVATAAAALLERAAEPEVTAELFGALYGRVLSSLRFWWDPLPKLELSITEGVPSLTQTTGGGFHARLPLGWLTEVWARELDVVDLEFVLSARPVTGDAFELRTVDDGMNVHTRTIARR